MWRNLAASAVWEPGKVRTTEKGLLSELRVKARLVELGAQLLDPVGHDFPFDVVAYCQGRFARVQIKTVRAAPNGGIIVPGGSTIDGRTRILTTDDCEVILAWHAERGVAYAVRPGLARFQLQLARPARNTPGQHPVRVAADHELASLDQVFVQDRRAQDVWAEVAELRHARMLAEHDGRVVVDHRKDRQRKRPRGMPNPAPGHQLAAAALVPGAVPFPPGLPERLDALTAGMGEADPDEPSIGPVSL